MQEAVIRPLGTPGDLGWLVMANAEAYAQEYGWNADFERLAVRIVADFATDHDPERERAWIAELDGRRVEASSASPIRKSTNTRFCVSCSSTPPAAVAESARGSWTRASSSRAPRVTRGCAFGPTTHWPPRAISTSRAASS